MYRESPAVVRLPHVLRVKDYVIFTPYLAEANTSCAVTDTSNQDVCSLQPEGHTAGLKEGGKWTVPAVSGVAMRDSPTAMSSFPDLSLRGGELPVGPVASEEGVTPLHSAASVGNLQTVQMLLDRGCGVDAQTRTGVTALHCAAGCGHDEVVRCLLKAGTNLSLAGRGGRTAVFMAADNGHHHCMQALLDAGADVSIRNEKGLTPLCACAVNDCTDLALTLLSHDPSCINICDSGSNLPLHYAVRNGNATLVTALLTAGCQRNVLNKTFESPVHIAVVSGNLQVLEILVDGGCDVNLCEPLGNVTPLHVAVNMHSDISLFRPMMQLLLKGSCVLNWRAFSTLETPLYRSLALEKTAMSCELLSHGADPNLASPFDITALQRACEKHNTPLVNLMLNCGINWKRERWLTRYDTVCAREITELINRWKDRVVSLQALCRIRVRGLLEERLEWKLNQIELPQKVRNYILLRDLF